MTDLAEDTLKDFAEIHIRDNNEKYVEGARRILLTLSTSSSLLAADVAYHREGCYIPFRSHYWLKRGDLKAEVIGDEDDTKSWEKFYQLYQLFITY